MPSPNEHKTVQARILAFAQEIGWAFVQRGEAERRRGFDPDGATPEEQARRASLYFGDLLHGQVRAFNPLYKEAEGALIGQCHRDAGKEEPTPPAQTRHPHRSLPHPTAPANDGADSSFTPFDRAFRS